MFLVIKDYNQYNFNVIKMGRIWNIFEWNCVKTSIIKKLIAYPDLFSCSKFKINIGCIYYSYYTILHSIVNYCAIQDSVWKKCIFWSQSYQTFFLCRRRFFQFFATKLGHFIVHTPFVICYKHSSLTARIGKPEKWKFGRIDSWW